MGFHGLPGTFCSVWLTTTEEIAALAESDPQRVLRLAEDIRRMLVKGHYKRKNVPFLGID